MAENPIRKEDIIDGAGISAALKEIIGLLDGELKQALINVTATAKEYRNIIASANTATREGQESTRTITEKTQELSETKKVLIGLEKELERATAKYNAIKTLEGKALTEQISKTKTMTKALTDESKQAKDVEGSYNSLNKQLNELIKKYKSVSASQRGELTPQIQKLDKELKKLDEGIGRHQRNVGNYGSALAGLPGPMGQAVSGVQRLSMAFKALLLNPVVLVISAIVAAIAGLVAAFKSTDKGGTELAARFEQVRAVIDVLRQRFINITDAIGHVFKGEWKEAGEDMRKSFEGIGDQLKDATKAAYDYAYAMDRLEDSENNYISQAAENKNKIAKLEFLAQDRSRSVNERKKYLKEALALGIEEVSQQKDFAKQRLDEEAKYLAEKSGLRGEDVIGFIRMTDAEQENASEALKTLRNNNEKKFKDLEDMYAKWIDLDTRYYEENKRNISRLSGFENEARKEEEESKKEGLERAKKYWEDQAQIAAKATENNTAARIKVVDDEYKYQLAIVNQTIATEEEKEKRITEIRQKYAGQRMQIAMKEASEAMQIISDGIAIITDLYSAQKQRELNAAGDNAKKREEIEKKYYKKEQALAISQAVVNGALAITKAQSQTGVLSFLTIPLIVAQTLAQIAVISSQKFAKGGFTGKGSKRDETGERIAGIVHENEFVINKKQTRKYRPLLEAIHKDDSLAIASAINNTELVWDKTAQIINRQDPYTQKMFEIMQNTPVVYTDSYGNTVLSTPNGRKKIIKRKVNYSPSMMR